MAALMVPFGLKSFFGLYPESRRFLIYRRSLCANVGVAAVADSSTAAARALNEIIVVFLLYLSVVDPRADKTRRSRFVRRACCLDCELSACSIRCGYLVLYVGRPHAGPIKFRFNKSTRLETRVTESPVGTFRTFRDVRLESGMRSKADVCQCLASDEAILVRCYWIASCRNWARAAPGFP